MWFFILAILSVSPRLVLFILWLVTDYISSAFESSLWPFLGFVFMPWTTLWCAYVYSNGGFGVFSAIILVFCVLVDLGEKEHVRSGNEKEAASA